MANGDPVKILELSSGDWMKGISLQDTFPIGGIFQSSSCNFDPFETMGYLQPALAPVQLDDTKIVAITNSICGSSDGSYVFGLADRSGAGAKNLFRINVADNTVTNYSMTCGSAAGSRRFRGLVSYKGRLVTLECETGSIYSVTEDDVTETYLGISPSSNITYTPPVFHVAPDGNCYFTLGVQNGEVGRIDTVSGAGTNTANAFTINPDLVPKDFTDDGTYEIIIADNNPSRTANVSGVCKVYFWDMDKPDADLILTIPDSYLIAARFVGGRLLVIGASGIWQCGIGTAPTLIVPLDSDHLPSNPYQVSVKGNILYWASVSSGAKVYAYGAKVGKPIFFAPYQTTGSDNLHTTFIVSGNYFYAGLDAGTNTTKMYVLNSGSTRTNATVQTAPNVLPYPFKFAHAKVVLKSKLTSGQAIALTLTNSEGLSIMASTTKSYSASNPIRSFIFKPAYTANQVQDFEDIYATINPQGGAVVQRVVIYGTPLKDYSEKS